MQFWEFEVGNMNTEERRDLDVSEIRATGRKVGLTIVQSML